MRYRKSCGPELEAPPDAPHVVGASCVASRRLRSTVSCTGDKSADSVCDGSGNAATTIDAGLSEAAVVTVAAPAAGSAAVATSTPATAAFATTALAVAIACDSTACPALAARAAAPFSIGTAPVFPVPAEPKPASQPTRTPARTSDPQNAGATVVNRRGFMIPSPPKTPPERVAQPSTRGLIFDQDMTEQWRKLQAHRFFRKVLPECNAPLSDQQTRLSHCNWSNFRPTATRFEDEAVADNATHFGWPSHVTSLHEALDEEADSIHSFHRFHTLYGDRRRSVSVLAATQLLAGPLRSVKTQAPPPADKL